MRIKITCILIFSTFLTTKAQDKIYQLLQEGYQHTIVYDDYKVTLHTKTTGSPGRTEPGKKYYWYNNNQLYATQGGYSGKLLDGSYAAFYNNGNLKEQGQFKDGLKTGLWQSWDSEGQLITKTNYKDGLENGTYELYAKGSLTEKGTYQAGLKHGKVTKYLGENVQTAMYRDGKLVIPETKEKTFLSRFFSKREAKKS